MVSKWKLTFHSCCIVLGFKALLSTLKLKGKLIQRVDSTRTRIRTSKTGLVQHNGEDKREAPRSIWRRIRVGSVSRPLVQLRDDLLLRFSRLTGAKRVKPSENIEEKKKLREIYKSRANAGTSSGLLIIPSWMRARCREFSLVQIQPEDKD